MNITLDEAVEIYAKVLRHRYGPKAENYARERAASFKQRDDREGDQIWSQVADLVVQIEKHGAEPRN